MKKLTLLSLLVALLATQTFAQDDKPAEGKTWKTGLTIGLSLDQLLQINPRVGAGEDRLAFGGNINYIASMKSGRHAWDSFASWNVLVQRLGSGLYVVNGRQRPFQKSVDDLRMGTKYGYAITDDKKWYAATELTFQSQIFKTFEGSLLTDAQAPGAHQISNFFSPATFTYSIGIDWKPNDNFSAYYSPIATKFVYVGDDIIAATGVHGNLWNSPTDYDNHLFNFGSLLRLTYQNKFLPYQGKDNKEKHRLLFESFATFYFDYLQGRKKEQVDGYKTNLDVEWGTKTSLVIIDGLQITLLTNLVYDWDVQVQETDWDEINGITGNPVRKASFLQQLLISYTVAL